jgi:hypothetical protein
MADTDDVGLDDMLNRPGTYFNPQTEVLVIVDDSPELDPEVLNLEEFEGSDWIRISDEVPVDDERRDELLERFQVRHQAGDLSEDALDDEDEDELEPDDEELGLE